MDKTFVTTWPSSFAPADRDSIDLAKVIEEVKSCKHLPFITELRGYLAKASEAAAVGKAKEADMWTKMYKSEKKSLPAFAAAGLFAHRSHKIENHNAHSGVLAVDCDNLTPTQVVELKTKIWDDGYACYMFTSPSLTGIKWGVKIDGTNHLAGFFTAQAHYAKMGITIDPCCKNVNRLCYLSADPAAKWRSGTPVMANTPEALAQAAAYIAAETPAPKEKAPKAPKSPKAAKPLKEVVYAPVVDMEPVDVAILTWCYAGTVSKVKGKNHGLIHKMGRKIDALEPQPTAGQLETIFDGWYKLCLTSGCKKEVDAKGNETWVPDGSSVLTEGRRDYRNKFFLSLTNVTHPLIDVAGVELAAILKDKNYCAKALQYADDERWKNTVELCNRLAIREAKANKNGGAFMLTSPTLARVMGCGHNLANDTMNGLVRERVLTIRDQAKVEKGKSYGRRYLFN